jgi:hypothetical protein
LSAPSVTEATTARACSPRAHEVADVFHQDEGAGRRVESAQPLGQHRGIQVATCARVDLYHPAARGADALGIDERLLIAFHDAHRHRLAQRPDRAFQQGGLAGPRRAHQIHRRDPPRRQPFPVLLRQSVVLGQDELFQRYGPALPVPVRMPPVIGGRDRPGDANLLLVRAPAGFAHRHTTSTEMIRSS